MTPLQSFAKFYFDIGWLLMSLLGFGVGATGKAKWLLWYVLVAFGLGALAFYGKYGAP